METIPLDLITRILPIVILFTLLLYFFITKIKAYNKKFENYQMYLFNKRSSLTREDYARFLKREAAEMSAIISMSENKGHRPDPKYHDALERIEKEQNGMDKNLF